MAFHGAALTEGWEEMCRPAESLRPREDNLWMITSGVLVIAMNAAFGLLESGCVQRQNSLNIMMKNISDLTVGGLAWWLSGYALAFCSVDRSKCRSDSFPSTIEDHSFWFFQWTFAATAATIDSGAVAERIAFIPYVLLSFFTTGFIYPFAVQWAWGGGFLMQLDPPFYDYAGGAVVHMLGGFSALVAITFLGPRVGRFEDYIPWKNRLAQCICRRSTNEDEYMPKSGHATVQAVTNPIELVWGTFFLWFGWYGFNPGAAAEVDGMGTYVIGKIVVNTTLGAIGGGCCAVAIMLCSRPSHRIRADGLAVGVLSGLAGVTAGCKWFGNGVAFLVGCLGNLTAVAVKQLLRYARLDDVVAAIPVHLGGGLIGTLAIGFFAEPWDCTDGLGDPSPVGVFFAKGAEQERAWKIVATQLLGVAVIAAWASSATFVVLALMNQVRWLRVRLPLDQELQGIDLHEHNVGHDELQFRRIVETLVTRVSQGNVDLLQSFRSARDAFDLANAGPSGMTNQTQGPDDDCCFFVTVSHLRGAGGIPSGSCHVGVHISVEAISSSSLEPGARQLKGVKKLQKRKTKPARFENNQLEFDETFKFSVDMPKGAEDFAFVLFTIHLNGSPILQAHQNIMQADITTPENRGAVEVELDLYEAQEEPQTRFHVPDALRALMPTSVWGSQVLQVEGSKLKVRLGCPAGSRLLRADGPRPPAPPDLVERQESRERRNTDLGPSGDISEQFNQLQKQVSRLDQRMDRLDELVQLLRPRQPPLPPPTGICSV